MMKKGFLAGLCTIFATVMVLSGCGGAEQPAANGSAPPGDGASAGKPDKVVELNLGHTLAPESHYQATAVKLAELAAQKSGGTIKINVFPQSQLGGEVKMIQSARTGSLGMLITAQAPLTNTVHEYSIFDLPYLFDSLDEGNKVLGGPVGKKFLDMLPQHDLIGLGFLTVIERNVFGSKAINKPEDMKGMKVRVMQSPGYVKAYEAFGSQPTPMAYSEVYLSLQQKVVDGGDTSPDQFVMDKFIEVAKYYNKTKVHYLPVLLLMSKQVWGTLSANQQKALQEAANEALAYNKEFFKKSYDDSIAKMKAEGVTVVETDIEAMKKAAQPVYETLLKDIPNGKALYDEIQAAKK